MENETSLDKALTILELVAENGNIGLNTLSRTTGYPPATVHRILGVLVRRNYIRKDGDTKRYALSIKCLELSSSLRENMALIEVARPVMRNLMDITGETVNLVVYDASDAVYIDQVTNTNSLLRMFTRVGARTALYCTGVGKAYLATLPEETALEVFRKTIKIRHTQNTIVEEKQFLKELETIRAQGYAVDREEVENGVGCIAAAIHKGREVAGAISISGPSSRLFAYETDHLGSEVKRAAVAISAGMSGQ